VKSPDLSETIEMSMAAMLLAGTARSLPFPGQLKADLRKLAVNLVTFRGCLSFLGIPIGPRA
jgi:hypothetical protein